MKKILTILVVSVVVSTGLQAQQLSQYSQYMTNDFVLNPAVAGSKEEIPVIANVRRQWIGVAEAPVTQTLSGHAYSGKDVGIGAILYNDASGPTRRTGFNFAFSRHIMIHEPTSGRLSLGIAAQLFQYSIDKSEIEFDDPNDPLNDGALKSLLTPDAAFGALYYTPDYSIGFSVPNLFQTRWDLFDIEDINVNQFKRTYLVSGEYNLDLNEQWTLSPSFLFKGIAGAPMQLDINSKIHYNFQYGRQMHRNDKGQVDNKDVWLGVSYRTGDAMVALVGANYDMFHFAYSYDFTLGQMRLYSSGTHEISLGLTLANKLSKEDGQGPGGRGRSQRRRYY